MQQQTNRESNMHTDSQTIQCHEHTSCLSGCHISGQREIPESLAVNWGMGPSDTTAPTLYTITLELRDVPLATVSDQFTHRLGTWTKALTLYKLFGLPNTNNALVRSSERGSPSLLTRQSVRLCNGMICSTCTRPCHRYSHSLLGGQPGGMAPIEYHTAAHLLVGSLSLVRALSQLFESTHLSWKSPRTSSLCVYCKQWTAGFWKGLEMML